PRPPRRGRPPARGTAPRRRARFGAKARAGIARSAKPSRHCGSRGDRRCPPERGQGVAGDFGGSWEVSRTWGDTRWEWTRPYALILDLPSRWRRAETVLLSAHTVDIQRAIAAGVGRWGGRGDVGTGT